MAIGTLRAFVVDVNDLAVGEAFWSAITGEPVQFSGWGGQFSRIRAAGPGSILLQLVSERKAASKNRAHIDLTVEDVEQATEAVIALGGSLVRARSGYPPESPKLEWAVVADPFGNEFCLIRQLPAPT